MGLIRWFWFVFRYVRRFCWSTASYVAVQLVMLRFSWLFGLLSNSCHLQVNYLLIVWPELCWWAAVVVARFLTVRWSCLGFCSLGHYGSAGAFGGPRASAYGPSCATNWAAFPFFPTDLIHSMLADCECLLDPMVIACHLSCSCF